MLKWEEALLSQFPERFLPGVDMVIKLKSVVQDAMKRISWHSGAKDNWVPSQQENLLSPDYAYHNIRTIYKRGSWEERIAYTVTKCELWKNVIYYHILHDWTQYKIEHHLIPWSSLQAHDKRLLTLDWRYIDTWIIPWMDPTQDFEERLHARLQWDYTVEQIDWEVQDTRNEQWGESAKKYKSFDNGRLIFDPTTRFFKRCRLYSTLLEWATLQLLNGTILNYHSTLENWSFRFRDTYNRIYVLDLEESKNIKIPSDFWFMVYESDQRYEARSYFITGIKLAN